jgi:hypothetical protein
MSTITELDRSAVQDYVRGNWDEFIVDGAQLFLDKPSFIASTDDRVLPIAAVRSIAQLNCRRWARRDQSQLSTRVNVGNAALCGPYLSGIGEEPEAGQLGPPFSGGQCELAYSPIGLYTVNCGANAGSRRQWGIAGTITGPIRGVRVESGSWVVYNGSGDAFSCIDTTTFRGLIFAGEGTEIACSQLSIQADAAIDVAISDVVPINHLDNCGNPPLEISQPSPRPGLEPILPGFEFPIPGIGSIGLDLVGEIGDLIGIEIPSIEVSFELPQPSEFFRGPDAPTGPDDGIPGDQGVAGEPQEGGDNDPPEGEDDKVLTGVLVEILDTPPRASGMFNNTEFYVRGPYWVFMGGDAGLEQAPGAAIAKSVQYFHAPPNANRWRVVPNNGFRVKVVPFYKEN